MSGERVSDADTIRRGFRPAMWENDDTGTNWTYDDDVAEAEQALTRVLAEHERLREALDDIQDVCVGWTRKMTPTEKVAAIHKIAAAAAVPEERP